MFDLLKFYIAGLNVLDYYDTGLRNFYESFIAPIEINPSEAIKRKQMEYVYRQYRPISVSQNLRSSGHWKKETYEAKEILLDLGATERLAENYAEYLLPYLIEFLEREPTLLTKVSMELFLKQLQTSARAEANFEDFAEHLRQELQIFDSIELNMHLDHITMELVEDIVLIHPVTGKYYDLEHDLYHSLGLASPFAAKRFHTFLFRKSLFKKLTHAIKNFHLAKPEENGSGYISDGSGYISDGSGYISD